MALLTLSILLLQQSDASNISIPVTYSNGNTLSATQLNSCNSVIYNDYNGNITNFNIASGAAIGLTKLGLNPGSTAINQMATGNNTWGSGLTTDTVPSVTMTSDGWLGLGPGGSTAFDVYFKRSAALTVQLNSTSGIPKLDMNSGNILNTNSMTLATPLVVGSGGLGISTTPSNGYVPIGNGTDYTAAALTAGTAIGITNGSGSITVNNTGVTSLAAAGPGLSMSASTGGVTATIASPPIAQGRLTLSSTLPVPTGDITGATTIYYLPYTGRKIYLWSSTLSAIVEDDIGASGVNTALGSNASGMYDVFGSDATGGGTVTLSLVAWTNSTTRATGLVYGTHLGCLVESGTEANRYLGSVYLTATGTTEDTAGDRALSNYNNRVRRQMFAQIPTGSWTYASTTLHASGGSSANTTNGQGRFSFVVGVEEDAVEATFVSGIDGGNSTNPINAIGLNSTSAAANGIEGWGPSTVLVMNTTSFSGQAPVGYNYLQMLEACASAASATFYGSGNSLTTDPNSGMTGSVMN